MMARELPEAVTSRRAIVYVRQSTGVQVRENLESQRRQYALVDLAKEYGFTEVVVIDEDLGISASGTADRPGFRNMVGQICEGTVGAVLCLEASRLARNGRDWHHLLELCGLVGARVIDADGAHDPSLPNDRLLLGLKGTMSDFELTVLRRRLLEAAIAKARRGELRLPVPIGYLWPRETGLVMDPDARSQNAIRTVFELFDRLGSARQVFLHLHKIAFLFPRPVYAKQGMGGAVEWRRPAYRSVVSVLTNPFYAGAYAYGKSAVRTTIVDGSVRKIYGRGRPLASWTVLLPGHHDGYISWEKFEQNQARLARNAFSKRGGAPKMARGGGALLGGLLRCRRCGRILHVTYGGRGIPRPRYTCNLGHAMHGLERCISFGATRPDLAVAAAILVVAAPYAVEAALVAERDLVEQASERCRALELERQQAAYELTLAARRYESVDPDNRLVAAELERRWNAAMSRLRECEEKIASVAEQTSPAPPSREALLGLARDLEAAWEAPGTSPKTRQRLLRALVDEIVVDVDEAAREVVLVIRWRGGQHSEVRVRKPATGEHTKRAPEDADLLIREMAARWPDADVAATLNRKNLKTGQGMSWTAIRVGSYRRTHEINGYDSAVKDGRCLTMLEAAQKLGVTCHAIRKLIRDGVLPAKQVMLDAPWQILSADLDGPAVQNALRRRSRRGRPCRIIPSDANLEIPGL